MFLQLAILSHCLTDFIFQSNLVTTQRKSRKLMQRLKANLLHSLNVVIFLFLILILWYKPSTVLPFSFCIGLTHFLIDFTKSSLSVNEMISPDAFIRKKKSGSYLKQIYLTFMTRWKETLLFITDQILHFSTILLFYYHFDIQRGGLLQLITHSTKAKFDISLLLLNRPSIISILNYLIVYTLTCFGGRYAINCIINALRLTSRATWTEEGSTRIIEPSPISSDYIGIFERFIILTLVINEAYSAISFVFTAKSLARFRELDNRDFVEYYLIGTLMSTVLGIGGGLLLKFLNPY